MKPIAVLALAFLLGTSSSHAIDAAADGSWVPVVEFQFEDSDFAETLNWISGWSYALTALANDAAIPMEKRVICPTNRGNVESRVMLTVLNERFKGQRITVKQASDALWQGVKLAYPCPAANGG